MKKFKQFILRHKAVLKAIGMLMANCIISLLLILTVLKWQTQQIVSESEEKILLSIEESTQQLDAAINLSASQLASSIAATESSLSNKINVGFMRIVRGIGKIDVVYSDLLKEEKKKRVDVLLSDKTVSQRIEDARSLIKSGKYTEAHDSLRSVVDEQPENQEARFLTVYSLFHKNKMKKENYKGIMAELELLRANGYQNQDMDEIMEYITTELNAISIPEVTE